MKWPWRPVTVACWCVGMYSVLRDPVYVKHPPWHVRFRGELLMRRRGCVRRVGRFETAEEAIAWVEAGGDLVWMRRGGWAAHLYDAGAQQCATQHGRIRVAGSPKPLVRAPLGVHCTPYGRICSQCRKLWQMRMANHSRP